MKPDGTSDHSNEKMGSNVRFVFWAKIFDQLPWKMINSLIWL